MVCLWRWLVDRVRKSPNAWAIVGGAYLIVLPPIFACFVTLADGGHSNRTLLARLVLSFWTSVIESSWFWLVYMAGTAFGMGMILVGLIRAFQPHD